MNNRNLAKLAATAALPIASVIVWRVSRHDRCPAAIARAHHEALVAHDWVALKALYSPSIQYSDPDVTLSDREDVMKRAIALENAFSDVSFESTTSAGEGDTATTEWTYSGKQTGPLPLPGGEEAAPTGAFARLSGLSVFEVRDGVIVTERTYWDNEALHRELGLLKAEPGDA